MNANTLMEATGCSQAAADLYAPIFTKYFSQYGITSVQEQADFLGQMVVETGAFKSIT
jgi:predicted chitinase